MMTMPQIMETLKCARHSARLIVARNNIKTVETFTSNGRKYLYDITPEQLLKMREAEKKDPQAILAQQDAALKQLSILMGLPCAR
jgi:hypothetical protein